MFKKILLFLVVMIVAFCGYVALQPDAFSVRRSATMNASPADVFAQVNDFHNWQAWSPWARLDPNAIAKFSGPDSGKGAKFAWEGNDQVGQGDMEIVESKPNELIKIKLHFVKPFEGTNDTLFTFKPEGTGTAMTWEMSGKNNFVGKAMCMLMNMDAMVGGDFEKGLNSVKTIVEKPATKEPPAAAGSPNTAGNESATGTAASTLNGTK